MNVSHRIIHRRNNKNFDEKWSCFLFNIKHKCILSLFKAVDADLVRQTCYNFVYDKCPVVAAVGPTENLTDYNRMRAGMYWLRV